MIFGYQTICSASAETLVEVLRSLDGVPDEKICVRATDAGIDIGLAFELIDWEYARSTGDEEGEPSYRLDRSRLEPTNNLRKTRTPKEPTLPATRSTTSKAA